MIPKLFIFTKLLSLLGVSVLGSAEGTLAYYHEMSITDVCQYRVERGWNNLDCQHPCLIASIDNHVGEYWLVELPNCNGIDRRFVCLVVDCANSNHLESLAVKDEVVEIGGELARYCGYQDYVDGVHVWRLGGEDGTDKD